MEQNDIMDEGKVQKNKEKTPLSVMAGSGETFTAQGKKYKVKPLKIRDTLEFREDKLFIDNHQVFNMWHDETRPLLDKWLKRQVFDDKDIPVDVQKIMDDEWDLGDLQKCIQRMLKISG